MMKLSIEHQGRELVHIIALLVRCLEIPGTSPATRRQWRSEIFTAREELAALYAAGLSPTFLAPGGSTSQRAPERRVREPGREPAGSSAAAAQAR